MCTPLSPIRFGSIDDADLRLVRAKLDLAKSTVRPPCYELSGDVPAKLRERVGNSMTWAWVEGWQTAWSVVDSYLKGDIPRGEES